MSFTLTKPQHRKWVHCTKDAPFPILISTQTELPPNNSRWTYYTAYLIDGNILVRHSGDMAQLYKMGFFGKGTLSRHWPQYEEKIPTVNWPVYDDSHHRTLRVISRRKYLRRLGWARSELSSCEEETALPLAKKSQHHLSHEEPKVEDKDELPPGEGLLPDDKNYSKINSPETNLEPEIKRMKSDRKDLVCWDENQSLTNEDQPQWNDGDESVDPWATTTDKESTDFWTTSDSVGMQIRHPTDNENNHNLNTCQENVTDLEVTSPSSTNSKSSHSVLPLNKTSTFLAPQENDHVTANISSALSDSSLALYCNQSDKTVQFDSRCLTDEQDGELLVISDTDDSDVDVDDKRLCWRSVVKTNPFQVKEFLQLSMEEVVLDLETMWHVFCEKDECFIARYVVYHNLRSKGWVPKSGLNYGSDFVVYKQGPAFYHSTYSVIVKQVSAEDLKEKDSEGSRLNTWTSLAALNRVTEQVSKDLMLCYVIEPSDLTNEHKKTPACLSRFKVQEVVVKRMMSKQEQDHADYVMIP